MAKRADVNAPQRGEAVLALLRRAEPATQLARRYGVFEPTLYRWRDEFLAGGQAALANGKGQHDAWDKRISDLVQQIEKRHLVIGELTIANRILEKYTDAPR
jgi:transposase